MNAISQELETEQHNVR